MAWIRACGGAKSAAPFYTIKGVSTATFHFGKASNNSINFALVNSRIETVVFGTKLYEDDILTLYTENTSDMGNTFGLKVIFKKACTVNGGYYGAGSNCRIAMSSASVVNIINE